MGFEPGWGNTAGRILETIHMALDLMQAPDDKTLSNFLSRLPMVFNVVIMSPHGFFGQSNVLGMPDTGGQVVYILDQVRALEREMIKRIHDAGDASYPSSPPSMELLITASAPCPLDCRSRRSGQPPWIPWAVPSCVPRLANEFARVPGFYARCG